MIALITFRHQNGRPELSIGSNISSQNKNVLFSIRIILLSISALKHTLYQLRNFSRYGEYLTHSHSHITWAMAAMDSCFVFTGLISMAWPQERSLTCDHRPCHLLLRRVQKHPTPRKSFPWLPLPRWYGCVHAYTSVLKLVIFFTAFLLEERRPAHLNFIFENGQKYK